MFTSSGKLTNPRMYGSKRARGRKGLVTVIQWSVRLSKNPCYERPYCVTGVIKLTGSKRAPKGICTDKDDGTRKGTELQLQ